MKKRGVIGQPFIYIFAIIVIALIFLFGFNMVKKLSDLNDRTVYLTFKNDFEKHIDNLYYKNEGSILVFDKFSRNKPLRLPGGVEQVCFEEGLVKLNSVSYKDFNVNHLTVDNNFCINVEGNMLSFKLENIVINEETYVKVGLIE